MLLAQAVVGTCFSDYCWTRALFLLGPLVTTLGITLTFPISGCYDRFVNDEKFTLTYFAGSVLIFTAFDVISYVDYNSQAKQRQIIRYE